MPTTRQTRKPTKAQLKKIEKSIMMDDSKAFGKMLTDQPITVMVKLFKNTPPSEETYDLWDNDVELDVYGMLNLEKYLVGDMPMTDDSGDVAKMCLCNIKELAPSMKKNLPRIFHKYQDLIFNVEALFVDEQREDCGFYLKRKVITQRARAKHQLIEDQLDSDDEVGFRR